MIYCGKNKKFQIRCRIPEFAKIKILIVNSSGLSIIPTFPIERNQNKIKMLRYCKLLVTVAKMSCSNKKITFCMEVFANYRTTMNLRQKYSYVLQ
jgi:hypothetical protein